MSNYQRAWEQANALADQPTAEQERVRNAAPDLLRALIKFVECVEEPDKSTWEAYKMAQEAITKATGKKS
jgi:hypothetical protein